jgi:hypothetical protein
MAASVLAIGLRIDPAVSLPVGSDIASLDTAILKAQQQGGGMGQGQGERGGGGAGQGGGPAARGGDGAGGGAMRQGGGGMREGGGMRQGDGGMREGGAQLRSGERGARSDGGAGLRTERGARGDRGGVEFGYRERGVRGNGPRAGVYIERDRDRRRHGRRDGGGIYIERGGYGYLPASCDWLRRRALATDSPYWWRRYRACRG